MSPQDNSGNDPAAPADPQESSLSNAENDATANFWFENVGNPVTPCSGVPAPTVVSQDKKHWVEIALFDKQGNPIPDEDYSITVPGGSVVSGTLSSKGRARVDGIDAGTCKVSFPNLDQHSWKPR